ncbi:hypothetical protein ACFL4T_01985 [candidate division KSB1 bacterium]
MKRNILFILIIFLFYSSFSYSQSLPDQNTANLEKQLNSFDSNYDCVITHEEIEAELHETTDGNGIPFFLLKCNLKIHMRSLINNLENFELIISLNEFTEDIKINGVAPKSFNYLDNQTIEIKLADNQNFIKNEEFIVTFGYCIYMINEVEGNIIYTYQDYCVVPPKKQDIFKPLLV